jgi:hypothetical protein
MKDYAKLARSKWPKAEWIQGSGRFASVAYCKVTTVILYPTREAAEEAKAIIDATGCSGSCHGAHEVIDLADRPKRRVLP